MIVAAILAFIFSWNNFIFASASSGRGRCGPCRSRSSTCFTFEQLAWGALAAAALIVTLPVLILTAFVQRQSSFA